MRVLSRASRADPGTLATITQFTQCESEVPVLNAAAARAADPDPSRGPESADAAASRGADAGTTAASATDTAAAPAADTSAGSADQRQALEDRYGTGRR